MCSHVQVRKTDQSKMQEKDSFPHFTELIVKAAHKIVAESQEKLNLKQVRGLPLRVWPGMGLTVYA